MKKNNKTQKLKRIIIVLIILVIIIGMLLLLVLSKQKTEEGKTEEQIKEEKIQQEQTKQLKLKGERERMQEYLIMYLNYIEKEQYEKAYGLLYQDFKDLYYPDLEFYKQYVKRNYFPVMRIEFEDIQRQGEYYILSVTLIDIMNDLNSKQQKFVIYEKEINDFTLSFQAQ